MLVRGVVSTAFITEICGQLFGPRGLGIVRCLDSKALLVVLVCLGAEM